MNTVPEQVVREVEKQAGITCDGCGAEIVPLLGGYPDETITRHEWFDDDDDYDEPDSQPSAFYHVDCCPRNHISEGDCEDE
jgi:hypothetical protein